VIPKAHSSGFPEDALDHVDGNPVDFGDLGNGHSVIHSGSDARMLRPRDLARGPGLGVDRCCDFLAADRCRRQHRQHARFPLGSLVRRRGVRNRWLDGLPFRREERLGSLALARDRLTVVTAEVVLLLPVIEHGSLRWSKPISS